MIIEQETRLDRAHVWGGMDFDLVTIQGDCAQRPLATIDLDSSNFGMRHSQRLRQMLNGLLPAKLHTENLLPVFTRQKIIQPAKKQKVSCSHIEIIFAVK